MQQEQANPITGDDGQFGMFWLMMAFCALLILTIVRELLPDRKQKRRRRLGSDIRRIDPETVDTSTQQDAPPREEE